MGRSAFCPLPSHRFLKERLKMEQSENRIEEILGVNRKWLPPSPHREEIAKAVESGRAYIERRGHNVPPLLVFDGEGGAIELPRVRYENTYRGMQLVAGEDASQPDQTRHPDACGSVDELKGLLSDSPELAESDPDRLLQLLTDACYMISRMHRRGEEYENFISEVASLCKQVEAPEPKGAYQAADEIRAFLKNSPQDVTANLEKLHKLAEDVRTVASKQERGMKAYKDLSIRIGRLYRNIKGGRNWEENEKD